MPETDLALLIRTARMAGEIATSFSGKTARRWDKSDGAGPVTEADLEVNEMLLDELCGARPGYGWLSEETEDGAERLESDKVFIIDPIDGTRSFIEGSSTWAHSLAIAEKGIVTAAVIYLPLREKLYAAGAGQGARLNDATIAVSPQDRFDGATMLAAKPAYDPRHWRNGPPAIARSHRPSLAYRLCLVAEGRFDAMLTLRPTWEWDIAAGDLILREAGAAISDRKAQPLIFNNAVPQLDGVLTANPALHRLVSGALAD